MESYRDTALPAEPRDAFSAPGMGGKLMDGPGAGRISTAPKETEFCWTKTKLFQELSDWFWKKK